MLPLLV